MIKFNCGQCGQKIGVPDAHAGKRGKCPNCGAVVSIPAPAMAVVATPQELPLDALAALAQHVQTQPRHDLIAAASEPPASVVSPRNLFVEEPPLTGGERKIIRWGI